MSYEFKSKPFAHQLTAFQLQERKSNFAITADPRTGKTKIIIDTAAAAYERGKITTLLIAAPKGVDSNWITDELAPHLPDRIVAKTKTLIIRASQISRKLFTVNYEATLKHDGFAVICFNIEATRSPGVVKILEQLLKKRPTLFVIDESSIIKSSSAKQTRIVTRLGRLAVARRILDGTPNAESPLELFAQYRFLDPKILGFTSFYAFRNRYAVMEQGYDPRTGVKFDKVAGYQHLEELQSKLAPHTYRVRREDVFDMPPKVYQKRRYTLSPEQQRVYDSLLNQYVAELYDSSTITAANILTRYLRLQQVLSNRIPTANLIICPACHGEGCPVCDEEGVQKQDLAPRIIDNEKDPRLDALRAELKASPTLPTLIWCRFRNETTQILQLCKSLGRRPTIYDGGTSDDDRQDAKSGFQSGRYDVFIGSPAAGGRGLTLSTGRLVIYYSNYFSLRLRLQSEDRAEAPGKPTGTEIVDIVAEETIDEVIIDVLRKKRTLSDFIQGDKDRKWL